MAMLEPEYYEKYKAILDQCIPQDVLSRLLGKTGKGEQRGDAWEPPESNDNEVPPWER